MPFRVVVLVVSACALVAGQQGSLTLTVGLNPGFSTTATSPCAGTPVTVLQDVIRTETLFVQIASTPSQLNPPPVNPPPRRLALLLGVQDCSGSVTFGGSPVFVSFDATPEPIVILDSFTRPSDPTLDPLVPGSIASAIPALLFGAYGGTIPPLAMQAVAEDVAGSQTPFLVSNPVILDVVNPQTAGFAPAISGLQASGAACLGATSPGGSENGGTTITLTGTNFPAHSDFVNFPPTVMVGSSAATSVTILSQTALTVVTPATASPTCPPATAAGLVDVTYQNHPLIAPGALPALSPIPFAYCSGRTPAVASTNLTSLDPEGGEAIEVFGFDFLWGGRVIMEAQANPALTITIFPPDSAIVATGGSCAAPTPTRITLSTPPFCAGPVTLQVVNPDGVPAPAPPIVVSYHPSPAHVTGVAPSATIPLLGVPATFGTVNDVGSLVTVTGQDFIAATSPLFGAPTVPQGAADLHPTRTEIIDPATGAILYQSAAGGAGVTSSTQIQLTPAIGDQTGAFRPWLGMKWLRVVNPPCVDPAPAPADALNTARVLIRDAAPPVIGTVFPNVITPAGGPGDMVASMVRITGSNFFVRRSSEPLPTVQHYCVPGGPPSQQYCGPGAPPIEAIEVPAVAFGSTFSRLVMLVSENEILAEVPPGLVPGNTMPLTVFNPDGRSATSSEVLHVVPRLTDPSRFTPNLANLVDLDENALLAIANIDTNPFRGDQAIFFVPNPSATADRIEDIASGGDPAVTSNPAAYEAMFLLNTRVDPSGSMRFFDFNRIDVPATITLPNPVNIGSFVIQAGVKRVIFKAASFYVDIDAGGDISTRLYLDQNYPLVLRAHDDFTFGGILDVSGDTLANQAVASSPTLKFQYRCEWQTPPAGGGIGGRGGLHYSLNLADLDTGPLVVEALPGLPGVLSQPNLGTSASVLKGRSGREPLERADAPTAIPPFDTGGRYGLGRAPFGGLAGAGAGGGFATPGAAGQIGATTSQAAASDTWGNATNLAAGTAGRPIAPGQSSAISDAFLYGGYQTASDFAGPLGAMTPAFPHRMFLGGSGGGGGGGSLAVAVPCVSVGGRGGNGGGGIVLLADRVFKLGPYGRIYADGEKGQLGIDAFPFANGEPLFVLCAPGGGGGGAGGTVFIAAVADADLSAPASGTGQRIVSAMGGPGGAPAGGAVVTTAHGGSGGDGRIRVAINQASSTVALRQSQFAGRTANMNITPDPGITLGHFFFYPYP